MKVESQAGPPAHPDTEEGPRLPHPSCAGCPAGEIGQGYVPAEGPLTSPVLLLGQGPGRKEREVGKPFFWNAPSGRRLNWWLMQSGWTPHVPYDAQPDRSHLRVDNAVRCHLTKGGKDRTPTDRELAHCRRVHWGVDLEEMRSLHGEKVLVIPLGTAAIRAIYGKEAGEEWAGSLNQVVGDPDKGYRDVNRPADWGRDILPRSK